jgi:hypothetical protein
MSYDRQAQSALQTLLRRGAQLVLTTVVAGVRNPVTQTSVGGGPQSQTVVALIAPATIDKDLTIDQALLVRRNRRALTIAGLKPDGSALDFEPDDNQTIVFENAPWRLAGVSRFAPDGGAPVLFFAEATR